MLKRVIVGSVVAAGLVAAAPAGAAGAADGADVRRDDAPPPLPSLVQTRLTRVDNALERLTDDVNEVDAVHAAKAGKVVRRQLAAAWRGARYYITHAPPPPAEDAQRAIGCATGVRRRAISSPQVRAKISQDDEGPVIADPVTTAMAVFDEFHNVSSTVIELTDGARVAGARRDEPDAVPGARPARQGDRRRAHARAAGAGRTPPMPACERSRAGRGRGDVRRHDAGAARCCSTTSSSTSTACSPTRPTCGRAAAGS